MNCLMSTLSQKSNKLSTYIGFSIKSRQILFGYEAVRAARKDVYLIVSDVTLGESSMKKVMRFAENKNIPFCSITDLSSHCGRSGIKCIGLTDKNLASAAQKEIKILSEVVTDE